jgi:hypothetical protein
MAGLRRPRNSRRKEHVAKRGGQGLVEGQRLYQLVRQTGRVPDVTFSVEFLDPGVQAFSFTFG